MIKVIEVESKKDLDSFINFPHDLYKNDLNYVPELYLGQKELLTKHPFLEHSEVKLFLTYDETEKIVGRIAAIENKRHNEYNKTQDGFFGFFDCIDNAEVANALFGAVHEWLSKRKLTGIIGPANFSLNETCGLLIEGFDSPPVIMMTYNAPYYQKLIEHVGLRKKVDLVAFRFGESGYDDKSVRLLTQLQERLKRNSIIIRKVDMRNFSAETEKIREVYNKAWDKNTGFVPMTDHEFNHTAKEMKMIVDPDFLQLAEQNGKIVGFALAIPDFNQVFAKIKRGRLLPWGIFKLLWYKRKVNGIRIILLGVIDGYRKMGIEACLYGRIIEEYRNKNYKYAEASWTLEHNDLINNAILAIKGDPYKKYRLFEGKIINKSDITDGKLFTDIQGQ